MRAGTGGPQMDNMPKQQRVEPMSQLSPHGMRGKDPMFDGRTYSPNLINGKAEGIQVKKIANPANGHGVGVSYSNV